MVKIAETAWSVAGIFAGGSAALVYASAPWWGSPANISAKHRGILATLGFAGAAAIHLVWSGWPSVFINGYYLIWLAVAYIDGMRRIIPNRLIIATIVLALSANAMNAFRGTGWDLLTALGLGMFYAMMRGITRGGIGMGDVKFGFALGVALGWPAILSATLAGL
ncbi:MAG: prepilin peptidase, partial [Firmicutes bacterium]|nr:prepilin peptidase [Bacillota bacterium]